eukprot:TRINITY_DN11637_c0_g1_i1.p1 TRINITY_DN11637_c0_g1~~TRINITY_DN11637_c0_g1_i1.p1  ORF type:complete len:511 (+),score=87.94 TRINITY_DN11637_c0_g1_i1:100-1632(+)
MQDEERSSIDEGTSDSESAPQVAEVTRQRSGGSTQSFSRTPEPKPGIEPVVPSDTDSEEEEYETDDPVLGAFLKTKMLLHTRLAIPTDIEMPPYRLLGVLSRNNPELWGHVLATLADEWCCAYLNTSGGVLVIGVESDGTIEGIPINTHHSQLHSFLTPFFSTLDNFWPPITQGLLSLSLVPVCTPVGEFDPYFVIVIRVKKGPMPCYINSAGTSFEGDHVLEEIEDKKAKMSNLNANLLSKYLTRYADEKARKSVMMSDVIKGKKPYVFNYSSHWSHPPLTLVPEAATTTMVGITAKIDGDSSTSIKLKPPCNHASWSVSSRDNAVGRCRVTLICTVCKTHWKFAAKDSFENLCCTPFSEGNCQQGSGCRLIHIVTNATASNRDRDRDRDRDKPPHNQPAKKKKPPKKESTAPAPLSGLMRGPPKEEEVQQQPATRPPPRIVPTVPPELMNAARVNTAGAGAGLHPSSSYGRDDDLSHSDPALTPKHSSNTPKKRKRGGVKQKPRPKVD